MNYHIKYLNKKREPKKIHVSRVSTTCLKVVETRDNEGNYVKALALMPNCIYKKSINNEYDWSVYSVSHDNHVDLSFNGIRFDIDLEQLGLGDVLAFDAILTKKPDYLKKSIHGFFLEPNPATASKSSSRGKTYVNISPTNHIYSVFVKTAQEAGDLGFFVDDDFNPISFPISNATFAKVVNETIKNTSESMQTTVLAQILKDKDFVQPSKAFTIEESKWLFLVRNFVKSKNTLITGETGTGKTSVVRLIAKTKNAEILKLDMGSCSDAAPFLLGQQILTTDNGNTCTEYRESSLTLFLQKAAKPENKNSKFVVLLDEINRCPLNAANILFPLLDDERTLLNSYNPEGTTSTKVVNNNVWFVATANIGSSYTGTSQIDEAFMSRFLKLTLKDLTETELKQRGEYMGLHPTTSAKIAKVITIANTLYSKGEISVRLSFRDFQIIAEMVIDGYGLKDAVNFLLPEIFDVEDCVKVKANISVALQG